MVKILITGGLGFIGSNLIKELLKNINNQIFIVDNKKNGILKFPNKMQIRVFYPDLNYFIKDEIVVDKIYHLGIVSSSPKYKENPMLVSETTNDMMLLLEYAKKTDASLVLISSSSLYNGHKPPHKENMEIKVTDYYTEARYFCERMCKLYNTLYGVKIMTARLFSVYGKGDICKGEYANVITQFDKQVQECCSPIIYGDGKQTRDFINVKEVVRGLLKVMEYCEKTHSYEVFNIGTGVSHSFNEMGNAIIKKYKRNMKLYHIDNPIKKNYVKHTRADMTKSFHNLGFIGRY